MSNHDPNVSPEDAFPALSRRAFLQAALGAAGLVVLGGLSGCDMAALDADGEAAVDAAPTTKDSFAGVSDRTQTISQMTLVMVGDVLAHTSVYNSGAQSDGSYNFDHLFAHVADDLSAADLAIVNQETILGGTELGLSSYPDFNSPQEIGDAEAAAGVDVAAAATNHALDMGLTGIEAELSFWREQHPEVACLGIADSEEVADELHLFECNGISVAVLNYTEVVNGDTLPSSAPWCVSMLDEDAVTEDVAAARAAGADFVVVLPHWGTEYQTSPNSSQQAWAQTFLDLGVDVVIGAHPHVLQPVEVLERDDGHRMLVFWSLGNFVSGQDTKERMVGGMAQVTLQIDDGETSVADYALVPLVTHRASGTNFSTYRLADYTSELAGANLINSADSGFSVSWCKEFCAEVLGEEFDADACVLSGVVAS